MLHLEDRKEKVRVLLNNLTTHLNQATLTETDWHRWANMEFMCADYIKNGKPEWDLIQELARGFFSRVMAK